MFCQICSFYESDSTMIEYSCGHAFHRRCILPNSLSIIAPRCKVCVDGTYYGNTNDDTSECYQCYSGETAPRISESRSRNRTYSDDSDTYSDIWDEVNEYRDISASCMGFMSILSIVSIVLLIWF
jgi:hypothetical protein